MRKGGSAFSYAYYNTYAVLMPEVAHAVNKNNGNFVKLPGANFLGGVYAKQNRIQNAANVIMAIDSVVRKDKSLTDKFSDGYGSFSPENKGLDGTIYLPHRDTGNALYFDGHVANETKGSLNSNSAMAFAENYKFLNAAGDVL